MVQPYANGGACCFAADVPAVDPTAIDNTVPAGAVGAQNPCGMPGTGGCPLATG